MTLINSMMMIVGRRAEPGAIKKKYVNMNLGNSGDRLNMSQNPDNCITSSNAKSTACLRVSSMVMDEIVAPSSIRSFGLNLGSDTCQLSLGIVACYPLHAAGSETTSHGPAARASASALACTLNSGTL